MIRLFRAVTLPIKRLAKPLRLRWIDYQKASSSAELARLYDMRSDICKLERNEHFHQVQLDVRRQQIERGF